MGAALTCSPLSLPVPQSGGISPFVPRSFFGRDDESPPDVIKLSRTEQKLKAQLEPIVANELTSLFKAALALRRIRNARLFRTEAATFPIYLSQRYALSLGAVEELARSISTIEDLIGDLVLLPPPVPDSLIAPHPARKPTRLKPFGHRTGRPRTYERARVNYIV